MDWHVKQRAPAPGGIQAEAVWLPRGWILGFSDCGALTVITTPTIPHEHTQGHTYDLIGGEAEGLLVGRSVGWRQGWQGGSLKDDGAVRGVILATQDIHLLPVGSPALRHLRQPKALHSQ